MNPHGSDQKATQQAPTYLQLLVGAHLPRRRRQPVSMGCITDVAGAAFRLSCQVDGGLQGALSRAVQVGDQIRGREDRRLLG